MIHHDDHSFNPAVGIAVGLCRSTSLRALFVGCGLLLALGLPVSAAPEQAGGQPDVDAQVREEVQREILLEQTCEEWEKVRRCVDAAGEVQLECASRGPLSRFWASLRGGREDDEVRKTVVRDQRVVAPAEGSGERADAGTVSGKREASVERKVKARGGDFPTCKTRD